MDNQPVLSFLTLLFKYLGYILIVVLIGWRFLVPTSIGHVSLGKSIYNRNKKMLIINGVLFLLASIWFILFLEKPSLWGAFRLGFKDSIVSAIRIPFYILSLLFFILSLASFYFANKESKTIELSEDQKFHLTETPYKVMYPFWIIFTALMLFSSNVFLKSITTANSHTIALYKTPHFGSKFELVTIKTDEITTSLEWCYFYKISVKNSEGIEKEGYILKNSPEFSAQNIKIIKDENFRFECKSKKVF